MWKRHAPVTESMAGHKYTPVFTTNIALRVLTGDINTGCGGARSITSPFGNADSEFPLKRHVQSVAAYESALNTTSKLR